MSTVTFRRGNAAEGWFRAFRLYVDDVKVGTIDSGQTVVVNVAAGHHTMLAKVDWCSSPELSVSVEDHANINLIVEPSGDFSLVGVTVGRATYLALYEGIPPSADEPAQLRRFFPVWYALIRMTFYRPAGRDIDRLAQKLGLGVFVANFLHFIFFFGSAILTGILVRSNQSLQDGFEVLEGAKDVDWTGVLPILAYLFSLLLTTGIVACVIAAVDAA